jgi:hypothetical protein
MGRGEPKSVNLSIQSMVMSVPASEPSDLNSPVTRGSGVRQGPVVLGIFT